MKIGDLVKDKRGNIGIITKRRSDKWHNHVWVAFCYGSYHTVHKKHLEVV